MGRAELPLRRQGNRVIDIRSVYTVGQLNAYIKNMFTQDYLLQRLSVKGEVSNCKYHASGHIYFTLKDPEGVVNCVMFAGSRTGLSFRLAQGQQVVVCGAVDVYAREGKYQLYAKQITLEGSGFLYEQFERLKRELEESGMFAPEYKQPIPRYIRTLGVVTADTGAAVRDIIQIAGRRNPCVQIILYPAIVQGEAAAESVVRGIRMLERAGVDVMIVGRGGGSIEDLQAFNRREVAQAVFDCSVPVISAVGHETDTTIIDFVADLRAPTPSAAAELAVADVREIYGAMEVCRTAMRRLMQRRIQDCRREARQAALRLRAASPAGQLRERKMRLVSLEERLAAKMGRALESRRHRLELDIQRMRAVSPLEKLNSGYAYVTDRQGRNIRSVTQVETGQRVAVRVRDGCFEADVARLAGE